MFLLQLLIPSLAIHLLDALDVAGVFVEIWQRLFAITAAAMLASEDKFWLH
jgi:hypothetical protein